MNTNRQHCSCLVVRSIEQGHSLHGQYLLGHLHTDGLFAKPALDLVRCGRRQDQVVQWVILQSSALAVVRCNELHVANERINQTIDYSC